MGIKNLSKLIAEYAPDSMKELPISHFAGRKIAIDASMSIYQFLIAVRSEGNVLTNDAGETTSHLVGLFYRTIRMVEHGIRPLYVFDGKPPSFKSGELEKRLERRNEAVKNMEKAQEEGVVEDYNKFNKRTVKVTREHNDECKKLLTLMGIPYVQAPCEAEAQCAALCKAGKVFATGSEDMDTLTFGSPMLLRHLTFSEARKMPITQIDLAKVLAGLEITMDQFIDICILLGCDYCDSVKGIGPQKALTLIKKHGDIQSVIDNLDPKKYPPPQQDGTWPPFAEARKLFVTPEVADPESLKDDLKWATEPDEEGLVQFLAREKGFSEDRVRMNAKKLASKLKDSTVVQSRLDSFFKPMGKVIGTGSSAAKKRSSNEDGKSKENSKASANGAKKKAKK